MADFAIKKLVTNFFNGTVLIPDIKSNFSTKLVFWKVNGNFHAANGTFR
jgi:hypothetical protein